MFTHTGIVVISASFVACLVIMIGIFVINKYEEWGSANVVYFMSFAAGGIDFCIVPPHHSQIFCYE